MWCFVPIYPAMLSLCAAVNLGSWVLMQVSTAFIYLLSGFKQKRNINTFSTMKKSSFLFLLIPMCLNAQSQVPKTKKIMQTDDYFGTKVEDPYRWLEDDNSAETKAWVKEENAATNAYLEKIPYREKIKKRLTEMWNFGKESAPFKKGDRFFWYKNDGLQNQNVLYSQKDTCCGQGEILLDPNTLSPDGTTSLSGIGVSKNAQWLAYGISKAGSDWVEIHVMDISKKSDLPDVIKWVKFSGMSWKGNGIYYSRYDEPIGSALSQKNKFHKLYFHKIGTTQDKDILVFEDKNNPNYNFTATVTDDENFLCLYTSQSTSGHKLMIKDLVKPGAQFVTVADNFDYENNIVDHVGGTFYMYTNNAAPKYKLVSFKLDAPKVNSWRTILPETSSLLEGVRLCNNKILANYLEFVTSKLYCFSMDGKLEKAIELPGICHLSSLSTDKTYDFATYTIVSFTSPEKVFYLDAKTWQSKLLFKPEIKFDSENYITEQVFYPSKDGTKISMFITHKKGLEMNEQTPCFIFGYGGFNISYGPEFRTDRAVFLEAGGIYCVPNIRGGGEYGEEWHKAGTKCNKQNVFDDFMAACDFLVAKKFTSYEKIAIHGRSNGGLLIGAVITQRPDICKVAIPTVGVLDMLRFH
ncbi:MAG: prolyl oligopeptidase family serine peptidase, partial [Bacteroidia bacterium]